jgi:transcriptional regulator GlxA family with amidase domain
MRKNIYQAYTSMGNHGDANDNKEILKRILTLRLEKAKQLLETTRMSLDSITFAVGYEDSNSFRRLFLQRVGLLPAAYRKKFQARAG